MKGVDFIQRAQAGWGDPPDWVIALADACRRETQAAVGKRFGVSGAMICGIVGRTYPSPRAYERIEQMVRGAYLGETVACPVLGDIARDRCLGEQARPFAATSSTRAALYRACRGGCPHYQQKKGVGHVG